MSDLIPSINWTDLLTIVKAGRIKDLKSCEIMFNQEHIFNVIIFHGDAFTADYARTQSEYLALKTNTVSGKDPEELLAEIKEEQCRSSSSNAKEDVVASRRRGNMRKSQKSGAQRVKVQSKGSTRQLTGASAGV